MSASFNEVFGNRKADPKAVEFINALKEKSQEGKIAWGEWENGLSAALPGGITAYFHSSTRPPYEWSIFTVQIGSEVAFQLKKLLPDSLISVAGPDVQGANDLFLFVVSKRVHPLDKALESIKKI